MSKINKRHISTRKGIVKSIDVKAKLFMLKFTSVGIGPTGIGDCGVGIEQEISFDDLVFADDWEKLNVGNEILIDEFYETSEAGNKSHVWVTSIVSDRIVCELDELDDNAARITVADCVRVKIEDRVGEVVGYKHAYFIDLQPTSNGKIRLKFEDADIDIMEYYVSELPDEFDIQDIKVGSLVRYRRYYEWDRHVKGPIMPKEKTEIYIQHA